MTARINTKTILTLAVVLAVFAAALLRSRHGQMPNFWNGWKRMTAKGAPSTPEDGIYAMFDAARAGDAQAYLNCFSGPLREQIAAAAKEESGEKFKAYLASQNSAVQGMAVTVTSRPSPDQALVRVEYVYGDHNEVQNCRMTKDGGSWKIANIDGAQPVQPIVPFGTKAMD